MLTRRRANLLDGAVPCIHGERSAGEMQAENELKAAMIKTRQTGDVVELQGLIRKAARCAGLSRELLAGAKACCQLD